MDGCTDGTFEPTSKKFFNCPERKGIYYPLESLKPDERYATEIAVDGNRKSSQQCVVLPITCTCVY